MKASGKELRQHIKITKKTKAHVLQLKDYIEANAGEWVLTHIDAVPDNFLFVEENGKRRSA